MSTYCYPFQGTGSIPIANGLGDEACYLCKGTGHQVPKMTPPTQYQIDRDAEAKKYQATYQSVSGSGFFVEKEFCDGSDFGFNYASSLIEKKDREISRLEQKINAQMLLLDNEAHARLNQRDKIFALEQQLKSCEEALVSIAGMDLGEEALDPEFWQNAKDAAEVICNDTRIARETLASLTEWRKNNLTKQKEGSNE